MQSVASIAFPRHRENGKREVIEDTHRLPSCCLVLLSCSPSASAILASHHREPRHCQHHCYCCSCCHNIRSRTYHLPSRSLSDPLFFFFRNESIISLALFFPAAFTFTFFSHLQKKDAACNARAASIAEARVAVSGAAVVVAAAAPCDALLLPLLWLQHESENEHSKSSSKRGRKWQRLKRMRWQEKECEGRSHCLSFLLQSMGRQGEETVLPLDGVVLRPSAQIQFSTRCRALFSQSFES